MSRKVKIFVSALVAVVLLTTGSAAAVMAQEESPPPPAEEETTPLEAGPKALLARVAEILDIPQEDLVSAFKQAQQEMREDAFLKFLDKAVEEGRITQEEANKIKEWWAQKPEVLGSGLFPHARVFPGLHGRGGHMWGWHKGRYSDNTTHIPPASASICSGKR